MTTSLLRDRVDHWARTRPDATEAEVIEFCRERLAHYQCPTSVDFADDLPRKGTGKVLKRTLREAYWTERELPI